MQPYVYTSNLHTPLKIIECEEQKDQLVRQLADLFNVVYE